MIDNDRQNSVTILAQFLPASLLVISAATKPENYGNESGMIITHKGG
jgi:hypothetical protein